MSPADHRRNLPAPPGDPPEAAEADRVAALRALHILDTGAEQAYDDITRLAAQACEAPIALVSLVDEDRQWFKSRVGLPVCETSREVSFCSHAIGGTGLFLVPDAAADPRFRDNPLVTGDPHIRFYAGVPLVTAEGHTLGSLCVLDRAPRALTPEQQAALLALGRLVVAQMELRRRTAEQEQTLSERTRMTEALRDSHGLLRAVIDGTTDAVFVKDLAGRYTLINAAGAAMLGHAPAEILGRDDRDLVPAQTARQSRDNDRRLLETGQSQTYEDTETVAGLTRTVLTTKDVYRAPDGRALGLIGVSRDITARKQAEAALRRSERRGRAVLEGALDCIITIDAGGRVSEWNPAAEKTFGWTRAEAFGRALPALIIPEPLRAAHERGLAHCLATGEGPVLNTRIEVPALRRDGTEFPAELTIVPVGDGADLGFTAFLRDLSAQKAAEEARRSAEERLRLLAAAVENANDVVLITEAEPIDGAGPRVVYANDAFSRMTGYAPEDILGKTPRILQGPDTCADTRASLRRKLAAWEPVEAELLNYRKDGTPFWSQLNIRPVADETGWYTHWVSVQRDVTARHDAEQAEKADARRREAALQQHLRDNEQHLSLIYNTASDLMFLVELTPDGGRRYRTVNAALLAQTGRTEADIIGKDIRDVLPEPTLSRVWAQYDRAIDSGRPVHYEAQISFQKDVLQVETTLTPIADESGRCRYVMGISRDVTARRALEAERERQLAEALERADHDPLTGLLNHRAFQKKLEEEADRAQRDGGSFAVAILDLDNFKFFNDAYGHAAGDDVLRQVADALRQGCRAYDTLARFGGDEFVLLLPGAAQTEDLARALTERLAHIGYRPPGYEQAIPLGATLGLAAFPGEAATRADVMALADARLRRAKSGGGEADDLIAGLRARLPASSAKGFAMLSALVTAVDTKDRYTRRHSEDVLAYSLQIAGELGLDADARQTVAVAALLHDVGKVGVPDAVLRKPGRLSDAEFQAIQQHPVMGAAIVGAVPGFGPTLAAVRHHHERWDGQGYPDGLRGDETPLIARLMSVADAFSAMTTDRPYRKGMTDDRAFSILEAGAGTQWDPACVRAFLRARTPAPVLRAE